jgi:hypothetical protein
MIAQFGRRMIAVAVSLLISCRKQREQPTARFAADIAPAFAG